MGGSGRVPESKPWYGGVGGIPVVEPAPVDPDVELELPVDPPVEVPVPEPLGLPPELLTPPPLLLAAAELVTAEEEPELALVTSEVPLVPQAATKARAGAQDPRM
jgi:hypothetical protein